MSDHDEIKIETEADAHEYISGPFWDWLSERADRETGTDLLALQMLLDATLPHNREHYVQLAWGGKTFACRDPRIVGFRVVEQENIVGQKWLNVVATRRDGTGVSMPNWHEYGVEVS